MLELSQNLKIHIYKLLEFEHQTSNFLELFFLPLLNQLIKKIVFVKAFLSCVNFMIIIISNNLRFRVFKFKLSFLFFNLYFIACLV